MEITTPHTVTLPSSGYFKGRKSCALFVRKHNLQVNLEALEAETKQVTRPTAKDWLFLVEGYRRYHAVENQFLDNFVKGLNIKTEDPIEPPFTADVAESASIEKLFAALSILVMDYLDFIADKQAEEEIDNEQLQAFFDLNVHALAKAFEVSPRTLKQEFQKLKWHDEEKLGKQLVVLANKRRQLINESNNQSKIKLAEILDENKHPNLFIMSGIEHAKVFTVEKVT